MGPERFPRLTLLFIGLALAAGAGQAEAPVPGHHGDPEPLTRAIAEAEMIMSGVKRSEYRSPHFDIATDVLGDTEAKDLAQSLEGAYFTIDRVLDLPLAHPERKVRVFYFADRSQHSWARGAYMRPGLLTFYRHKSCKQELLDVLVHEATHAFVDQFIVKPDVRLPTWLNEGFATYMGYSFIVQGQIQPGLFYANQSVEYLNGTGSREAQASAAAKRVARKIKRGPLVTLDELVTMEWAVFYGTNSRDHYDLSWAFVHFLRHGVDDGEKRFQRLMAAFGGGSGWATAFEEAYASTPSKLEPVLYAYVLQTLSKPERGPR
jgi:hypothetical protein